MGRVSSAAIAGLWVVSLVAAVVIAWTLASERSAGRAVSRDEARTSVADTAEAEALRRENGELRAEIERLQKAQKDAEHARLRVAFKQALTEIAEPRTPRDDALDTAWRRGYDALKAVRERGGTFAGLDNGLSLTGVMAGFGPEASSFLSNLVTDGHADMKEREMALFVLSHVRDRSALAALTKLRAPDVTELDYPYDLIELQVSSLSAAEVREFIPEINRQIAGELGTGEPAPERAEVLLTLALVHGDRESQTLMNDPRILSEDLSGAISLAGDIHTPAAQNFLASIVQNSHDERQSAMASDVLANW